MIGIEMVEHDHSQELVDIHFQDASLDNLEVPGPVVVVAEDVELGT